MPTKNPRLSVVLSPALAATLAAVAEEAGTSASSLVRGLLEQAEPAFARMLQLLKAARSAKGQIGQGVRGSMERVITDLQDAIALADSRQSRVVADLVSQAEAVKGRRAGGRRAAPAARTAARAEGDPRLVTRGSGTGKTRRRGVDRA